jgi:hypothetical protein
MLREFKVVTENKTYISLDGRTLIIEGFDTGAADTGTGGGGGGNRGGGNRGGGTTVKKESNVKTYELQSPVGFEYTIKNNVWHARKSDGSTGWFLLTNVSSIIKLITTYFNQAQDGYYINLKAGPDGKYKRADDRLYRFSNKKWQVKISGSWQDVDDPKNLNAVYGDPTKAFSSKASSTGGVTNISSDVLAGYARRLILAMDGGGTNISEILSVYRLIKTRTDLCNLHAIFSKDKTNQGTNLSYWLKGDLDAEEWTSLFKVLAANKLLDKEANLELQYGKGNYDVFFNTYLNNYKRANAGKK